MQVENPIEFRGNVIKAIKKKLDLDDDRSKNFEIGLYNQEDIYNLIKKGI